MAEPVRQVLTANRLVSGDVVYWRAGAWVPSIGEADIFFGKDLAEAALGAAQKFVTENVVVNPYLFEVRVQEDGIAPVKEREIVRASGPSIHADLGKQAEGLTPGAVIRAAARRESPAQKSETRNQKSDENGDFRI
jgi:Protein of unknown function (DUF2849)